MSYGYRRQKLASVFSPYELTYEIVPRMSMEYSEQKHCKNSTIEHGKSEIMALSTFRCTHMEKISGRKATLNRLKHLRLMTLFWVYETKR